jgi:small-conductance mechanosensitive channel
LGYYVLVGVIIAAALSQLGLDIKVLLGAAGVLTVAVGFAAQTSASNLISGLFLMIDRPFNIGDVIRVEGFTGEVLSIDLLSCRLRTMDNLMVRVPNESMVKSTITNLSHFPIRRNDIQIGVSYKDDIEKVRLVLFDVADRNPLCLQDPKPLFIFNGFGDSSVNIQFSVWTTRENYLILQNSIYQEIKLAFQTHGIEIPYPHRVLVTPPSSSAQTSPAKVRDLSDV